MYPTIKNTAKDPKFILNRAQQNIRSKQKDIYIFVEGTSDKKFLKNLGLTKKEIGFDGFDGKPLVKRLLSMSQQRPYNIFSQCFFIMDIDYDFKIGNPVSSNTNVFYHGYCNINKSHFYNDLEVFLFDTKAFHKILNEFDIDEDPINLKKMLVSLAVEIGYVKLADEILVKSYNLNSSILDGFNIEPFIRISDFSFLNKDIKENLKLRSPKREYVDELFEKVSSLKAECLSLKTFIKGHDLTKLLEIYLKHKGKHWANQSNLEMNLRVGFEANEYLQSVLGQSFLSRKDIKRLL